MNKMKIIEKEKFPKSFNIFITEKCNLNCKYCFVSKQLQNHKLNFISLKKAIDIFLNLPGEKKTISFNGGEPLIEYSLLKKTYIYAQQQAQKKNIYLDIAVMTNGTLLNKEKCFFFEKNKTIVKVSIDGDKNFHDLNRPFKKNPKKSSFEKILKNLKNFNLNKAKLAASLVFTPENLDFLLENIKFLQKIGFRWIEFYPEMYTLWTKEKLIRMKEIFKKFRNYYISLFLKNKKELIFKNSLLDSIVNKDEVVGTINIKCQKIHLAPDGNFYFCDKVFSLPENERKKYIIGNVLEGIDNEKRLFLIENFRKKIIKLLGKKCNKCPAKEYCFCPIGHYIYFSFKKLNLKRYFLSFCSVAKIYFDTFWKIKERLIYNPLFANIYKF